MNRPLDEKPENERPSIKNEKALDENIVLEQGRHRNDPQRIFQ
jgi:hypothetical protein